MIELKTAREIEIMRRAGRIVAQVLQELRAAVKPGVTTQALDRLARERVERLGGEPAFVGYRGYPATLCASVNDEVVHGIPGPRVLREGDIIGLDLGARVEGFYGDAAVTVPVGAVRPEAQRLIEVTQEALRLGIAQVVAGRRLENISAAVQQHAEAHGLSVVRQFVGHGIGRRLHEDPAVPNYGRPDHGPRLKAGMVIAIEPMVNVGPSDVEVLADGWTAVTVDHSLSAHFEHTVAITDDGPQILTVP